MSQTLSTARSLLRSGISLFACVALLLFAACLQQKTATPDTPSAKSAQSFAQPTRAKKPRIKTPPAPRPTEEQLHAQLAAAQTPRERFDARRGLFQFFRRAGRPDEACAHFEALLDEIEAAEGASMAERAAYADASLVASNGDFATAVMMLEIQLTRYPKGTLVSKALHQVASCHLERKDYVAARAACEKLIALDDKSYYTPLGWQKLALAYRGEKRHDEAIRVLDDMERKYHGTRFGEYALMGRGDVLAETGRSAEAQAAYEGVLKISTNVQTRAEAGQRLKHITSDAQARANAQ